MTALERQQRDAVVAEAMSWLKTPYHHEARVKGAGVDCAQLLYAVYVEGAGLIPPFALPPYRPQYGLHRSDEIYLSWIEKFARPVTEARPGDLVTYQFGRTRSHAAIVVAWPQIVHAGFVVGCTLDDAVGNAGLAEHQQAFYRLTQWED